MQKLLYLPLLMLFALASCDKPDNNLPPATQTQFKTDSLSLTLNNTVGATHAFTVQSNISWTVAVSGSWLRLNATNGSGNATITVTVLQANASTNVRTATITITPVGNNSVQPIIVTINQGAVAPAQPWSKFFGGSVQDDLRSIIRTSDGGYVVVGATLSNNGDVQGNRGEGDAWIMKLDAHGNKVWSKLFGGTSSDGASSVVESNDGGYIFVGATKSSDGDLSGSRPRWDHDIWMVKVDANGNKLWSKTFGGTGMENGLSIVSTASGGYAIAGGTGSNDGDVSGHQGAGDALVIVTDANGNKVWSKAFGGTQNDQAWSIAATADGSYVLAGSAWSNDGDLSGHNGGSVDAWVMKIDARGNKLWSKLYGGTVNDYVYSIIVADDGGYAMAGYTTSNDGDVSGNHGMEDAWLLKLDGDGNKQWQKAFGGSSQDFAFSVSKTPDGGYILAGNATSNDGDVSGNHSGSDDAWAMKLDASGNKQWSQLFGGLNGDYFVSAIDAGNGRFAFVGNTLSHDGDVSGNKGISDGWVMMHKP